MNWVSVDPGCHGGIAVIGESGIRAATLRESPGSILAQFLKDVPNLRIVVEVSSGLPGESAKTAFALGRSTGEVLGALQALGMKYTTVRPQKWAGQMGIIGKSREGWWENRQRRIAELLGPEAVKLTIGPKGGKLDGIADALLLAYWA